MSLGVCVLVLVGCVWVGESVLCLFVSVFVFVYAFLFLYV